MKQLKGKKILLGITGGIAAYKSADLTRRLVEAGADVRVVMTAGAMAFIQPLTFQALSGNPVSRDLLDESAEAAMGHIELARWADCILVAPATANGIASLAHGFAHDLLTTLCLATEAPIAVAPAMNRLMWANPATQANIRTLESRGIQLMGPAEGVQACGETGAGRLLEPALIIEALVQMLLLSSPDLGGVKVMITAGPTREAIDPVRFISNHSSGKMGYAVAEAVRTRGAEVTLVSGPVDLPLPNGVTCLSVESAQEMHDMVMRLIADIDIFIGVAAVADFRAALPADQKIKKNGETSLVLSLVQNPDILASVAGLESPPFTVGFAAETHDVERYARDKLKRKKLNMIAANDVSDESIGFHSHQNALTVFWGDDGVEKLALASKSHIANQLVSLIATRYKEQCS
ncbi:MAG: bifunctional phosphopantothenoylcysteine decarboxylase/phosphopantothenate--cysteine ligase CoaBC [Gammaproteobacteria bacterium]|nr:bifunctional phosphopantothenoylcysteine decarboxylase/phosphopantothenate--cysteine ligase CoaBC [Gammaproteobacteria bacterium]